TGAPYGGVGGGRASATDGRYAPGDRLYRNNHVETLHARDVTAEEARQRELASFTGIEGARLAHRLYRGSHAEALDGDCERQIVVGQNETLWDISELCDVSIFTLTDYNTNVGNPRHVFEGQTLFIPHANSVNNEAFFDASFVSGVDALPLNPLLAGGDVHHAEAGDTLSSIAQRHNVSAAAVANLNPGVDWRRLGDGATIKLPARKRIAPTPAMKAEPKIVRSSTLDLNRTAVEPGGAVRIAATGLPANADVALYRGPNRRSLDFVETVRTDENGDLFAEAAARAPSATASGGVIFAASVDGDYIYSPRVTILKLKNDLKK
ncbi:MAG: LysM peptidoglycan-binding domain-containing protein, partial [Pseudomonadota bacterium]